jgi:DNA repair exonuclease SbcCD ATPase subunit
MTEDKPLSLLFTCDCAQWNIQKTLSTTAANCPFCSKPLKTVYESIINKWLERESSCMTETVMTDIEAIQGAMEEYAASQTEALRKEMEERCNKLAAKITDQLEQISSLQAEVERLTVENQQLKTKHEKPKRYCPQCGSDKIAMFTSDDDICMKCGTLLAGE